MSLRLTPMIRLALGIALSLALALVMLGLATGQPSLGLRLTAHPDFLYPASIDHGLWIERVEAGGPAASVRANTVLVSITDRDGRRIEIAPEDLIEEPDTLASYGAMAAFFTRQSLIVETLSAGPLRIETEDIEGRVTVHQVRAAAGRDATALPAAFWLQIGVGLTGFWIGMWIWSLRRGEWATRMLALAGAGLMVSAFPAAVYSTRELALPGALFSWLSSLNHLGALTFGVGMIGVLLVYPRRLVPPPVLALPALVLGAWQIADIMEWAQGPGLGFHLSVVLAMAAILILVGVQYGATRGDPLARAALGWFGISVAVGAGAFVFTIIAPNLFGLDPLLSQGEAFLFFLLIYVGVALGVARYRLFQLDEWAFRILFYVVGVLLLIAIDAVLILTIIDERAPAFAVSLLLIAVLYLPLRDLLARWVLSRRQPEREALFRHVMDVALTPPGADQRARWQALLERCFNPLHIETASGIADAELAEDGVALLVPGPRPLPGFRLEHADGGRRLFAHRDAHLAAEIHAMLANALESRAAYEKGVAEERQRIARDIHDNIGVQLMGALHSKDHGRTRLMIRETLTDLRDIVNNASRPDMSFEEMLADLRMQVSEHLHAAGVEMDWRTHSAGQALLPLQAAHTLRSIVREAVQNALKHAGAKRIAITVRHEADTVSITVADDGGGFDPEAATQGNGLSNMRERVTGLGGAFHVESGPRGSRIEARFPITRKQASP